MYLRLTSRCNMSCEHCCYACNAKGEDMSLSTFRNALEYCEGDYISLGGGEPTLHPLFWQFLCEALGESEGVWLATNGSQTKIALTLAKLAKSGVVGVALSQDSYHDPIDDCVIEAFQREKRKDYAGYGDSPSDLREIRNVDGNEVNAGRCDFGRDDCPCSDPIVEPDGTVRGCGCANAPVFGNVNSEVHFPDYWEQGECSNETTNKEALRVDRGAEEIKKLKEVAA